ncbi:MAG: biotin carboxylase N-terminal domain-containing protein [Acidimicrobiales bacterium]
MKPPRPSRRITTLLVANRGEIATRIMRTARGMGLATVAVYSDADTRSPHVTAADLAVRLPGTAAADTYLDVARILDAAVRAGADAVHPGYGFLSESGAFARAVLDAGLVWVGPPPEAMDAMASKIGAKELMGRAGVPTLPSVTIDDGGSLPDEATLDELGWPLLVKASAGGGGRGMRVVPDRAALADAVTSAGREAVAAFGDGTLFLERLVRSPRHIEVQVMADEYDTVVALFERECSIQRRHQKIIEEAPSPAVDAALRADLSERAVTAARAVGYVNAGTVEFVLDGGDEAAGGGRAFFLEMNTRLQVEHPVTEAVSGLDLVRLQLLVAQGLPLPDEVHRAVAAGPQGCAIEARVYAEDPARRWLPQTGTLYRFEIETTEPGLRVDSGVGTGSVLSPYYDSMLAKVIAHAPTRGEAARRLAARLAGARIHGVITNRDLLVRVLRNADFGGGVTDTGFLERIGLDGPDGLAAPLADDAAVDRHAVAAALAGQARRRSRARVQATIPAGFRNNRSRLQEVTFDGNSRSVTVGYGWPEPGVERPRQLALEVDGKEFPVDDIRVGPDSVALTIDRVSRTYRVDIYDADAEGSDGFGETFFVDGPDGSTSLRPRPRFPRPDEMRAEGSALAPMPGGVVRVAVTAGERVEAGALLVVLEAMKMEHAVHAPVSGTVTEVDVQVGDQVESGQCLVMVQPDSADQSEEGTGEPGQPAGPADGT